MMTGREAYEADLQRRPLYHDGSRRKTWDQLDELARWSWNRPILCNWCGRPHVAPAQNALEATRGCLNNRALI